MQKWEYKALSRSRVWVSKERKSNWHWAGDWTYYDWDSQNSQNLDQALAGLGEGGWELVAVSPRASVLGGSDMNNSGQTVTLNYAGFTSDEIWVFKRPKP